MTPEETMFQEAVRAFEAGERARARDLLTRLLKANSNHPDTWLYMSAVVDTAKERVYCLKEVLRIDPQNEAARRGLMMMGAIPPDPSLAAPADLQRRNWQPPRAPLPGAELLPRAGWKQVALFGAGALALVGLAVGAILLLGRPAAPEEDPRVRAQRLTSAALMMTPSPVLTTPPGATLPAGGKTATPPFQPGVQYTPTPTYAATPHRMEAFNNGMLAFNNGDWPKVIDSMQQVLESEPESADVYYFIGEAQRALQQYSDALRSFNQSLAINPQYVLSYLGRARANLALEKPNIANARDDLTRALELDPAYLPLRLELANLELTARDPQAALLVLQEAAGQAPDSARLFDLRARAYQALEEPSRALADARKANQLDAGYLPTYRLLGELLVQNGEMTAAVEPLTIYTTYVTDDAGALAWLGTAYAQSGKLDEALELFDRALQVNARQFEVYVQRGQIYLAREDGEQAAADFRQAMRLRPEDFDANLGLGRAYLVDQSAGAAYEQFNEAQAYAENDAQWAQLRYWRALSLEGLNLTDEGVRNAAINDWQRLLLLPPGAADEAMLQTAREHLEALLGATLTPANLPTP